MSNLETAVVAGGCFWCTEAVFRDVVGVSLVESGYIGGTKASPTYKEVCTGTTGHAEAIRVTFDPHAISLAEIFDVFLGTHDPTQLNRQGGDIGTQYRSAMYYADDAQKELFSEAIERAKEIWGGGIVTEVTQLPEFFDAEPYHQDFFAKNPNQGYCVAVVAPKVSKVRSKFTHLLK